MCINITMSFDQHCRVYIHNVRLSAGASQDANSKHDEPVCEVKYSHMMCNNREKLDSRSWHACSLAALSTPVMVPPARPAV